MGGGWGHLSTTDRRLEPVDPPVTMTESPRSMAQEASAGCSMGKVAPGGLGGPYTSLTSHHLPGGLAARPA